MDTANLVTYAELFQLLAIFSGVWLAILSLMGSLAIAWYVRDTNRRDKENERRHAATRDDNERRHATAQDANERQHQAAQDQNERRHMVAHDENERRHQAAQIDNERRYTAMQDENERRHQELLRAIGLLYHHVHADGSPAVVPLPDVEPAVPAPVGN